MGENNNNLDISFSETALLLGGNKSNNFMGNQRMANQGDYFEANKVPPTQLRKLYEEEEKVFEQCKKAVFGNFFDQ